MGLRADIWEELDVKERLQMAMRDESFVRLVFEDEDGKVTFPMNWIQSVERRYFEFKPLYIETMRAPISKVREVTPLFEGEG